MDAILQKGDVQAFANPENIMEITVPHFFTSDGFTKSYAVRLVTIEKSLRNELWVLGESEDSASINRELGNLRAGVSNSYATDYIEQWERVVQALAPGDYFNDPKAYRAFVRAPSPLKKVMIEVRDNTTFSGGKLEKAGEVATERAKRNRFVRTITTVTGAGNQRGLSADAQIQNYFNDLGEWVGRDDGPAPIDDFVALVRNSFKQVLVSQNSGAGSQNSARLAEAMAPIEQAAFEVPDVVSGFVKQVASGGNQAKGNIVKGNLQSSYQREILPFCKNAIQSRYPFELSSTQDAGLREVRAGFGAAGKVTEFIDGQLTPYIEKGGKVWRWNNQNSITSEFDPRTLGSFEKATLLQDVVVNGLPLDIEVAELGTNVTRVELSTAGTSLEYDAENFDAQSIVWQLGGGIVRSSEIVAYNRDSSGRQSPIWEEKTSGVWSLFRAFDRGKTQNSGVGAVKVQFGSGENRVVFKLSFPDTQNPFRGNGLWSVKCPANL